MSFAQPSAPGGGDQFNAADHKGHLLIVYPKSYQAEVQTKNGPSSAADVDIVIVDKLGPDGRPLSFINARLFGNLANSVRNDLGGQVLGRLDQINTQGGRTPWILQNFTDADAAAATPVDAAYKAGQFKQPENPMQQTPVQPAAAPAQQWQGAPVAAPVAPQQQWNAPGATPAPAPPQTPAAQWNAPAAPPATAPPAAPAAAPPAATQGAIDPNLVAFLTSRGIQVPPGMSQQQAEAIAAALPQ